MTSHTLSTILAATLVASTSLLCGCRSPFGTHDENGTTYGTPVAVTSGSARTYVVMKDGAPAEIGIAIDSAGMAGLPRAMTGMAHTGEGHEDMTEYLLPLPAEAGATPYRTIEVDWNPHGHEPAGVYDVPHFDFHFYTISLAERNAIDPADPQFDARAANHPAAEQLPQGYVPIPGAVPRMGVHWIDPASPELHGQTFTHTFIYGSWDGRVTFIEPMITRAFLESRPAFQAALPLPAKVPSPGMYPSTQRIYWNADTKEYRVALTDFAPRQ
jgi:hypothetical protein